MGRFTPPTARFVGINQGSGNGSSARFWLIRAIPRMNRKLDRRESPRVAGASRTQREMGPALRPTPLSPAVGFRGKRFTPDVFKAPCRPKPIGGDVLTRRSLRCRFRQGRFRSEDLSLPPGSSEIGASIKASSSPTSPEGFAVPRPSSETPTLPTLRPRGFNGLKFGGPRAPRSHPSTARHLAVASRRFQNPFFLAGLSAFVSEGPIPVSMSGRCAAQVSRAIGIRASYPLLLEWPVDKGG